MCVNGELIGIHGRATIELAHPRPAHAPNSPNRAEGRQKSPFQISTNQLEVDEADTKLSEHILGYVGWFSSDPFDKAPNE